MDPNIVNGSIAVIAGILILLAPKMLNYIVALYLLLVGVLTLVG